MNKKLFRPTCNCLYEVKSQMQVRNYSLSVYLSILSIIASSLKYLLDNIEIVRKFQNLPVMQMRFFQQMSKH